MSIKFTSVPDKRLSASIDASSLTIKVSDILGWDGNALTSADFGTRLFAVLRNDSNTLMEIIELDPSTITSSSITVLKRGLKFDGDLTTEVTANKLVWVKNQTIVSLGTNPGQILNHMVQVIGDQTIAGIKTFSSLPATTAGNPVADNDLARKAYVDSVVAGSFPADRLVIAGTAGETITDGDLIYFDTTTNNEWMLCDADTASSVENVLLGIAQGAGTNGNAITNGVLLRGLDDAQSGMTAGDIMYASNTAGDIASSAGTTEVVIGIAKSATELYFSPRFAMMLTADQQDALVGTSGTPSSTNKFVTNDDTAENTANKLVRRKSNSNVTVPATPSASTDAASKSYADTIKTTYSVVNTTYDLTTASGTQDIAHGLGKTPKKVKITATTAGQSSDSTTNPFLSIGVWDGTTTATFYLDRSNGGSTKWGVDTTNIARYASDSVGTTSQVATISVDSTNITLSWTKSGSPTGTLYLIVESESNG